ncbi:nucleotidyltransferase [Spirochaetia bacterium]|nr:nucleotidyltransferase [Spirochaetia bacterium]
MDEDIRWKQRFANYKKAFLTVQDAVELFRQRGLSNLEKQGLIQGFEFTFELAWNVMKDFLENEGITGIIGSKGAIRQAFTRGLISDGQVWIDMLKDRNLSSHSYDETTAEDLVRAIAEIYYHHLSLFMERMDTECSTAFPTEP